MKYKAQKYDKRTREKGIGDVVFWWLPAFRWLNLMAVKGKRGKRAGWILVAVEVSPDSGVGRGGDGKMELPNW